MQLIGYDSDFYQPYSLPFSKKAKSPKSKSGHCCYCQSKLTKHNYTKDHIYPKSLGGRITKPCCRECNTEKGCLTLIQYAQRVGKRLWHLDKEGKRDTPEFKKSCIGV